MAFGPVILLGVLKTRITAWMAIHMTRTKLQLMAGGYVPKQPVQVPKLCSNMKTVNDEMTPKVLIVDTLTLVTGKNLPGAANLNVTTDSRQLR